MMIATVDIWRLRELALQKEIDPKDFDKELRRISSGTNRKARWYRGSANEPIKLYRGRVFQDKSNIPAKISGLSFPPSGMATAGRANESGESIFYASAGKPTVFVELKDQVKTGALVAVSEWRIFGEIVLQEIGLEKTFNDYTSGYESLMHELFTFRGNKYYGYTREVANYLMSGNDVQGIIYPSIEAGTESENFAIKPSFIDLCAKFAFVKLYSVDAVHANFKYEVTEIDFATPIGLNLDWKGRRSQWTLRRSGQSAVFKSNGWEYEVFDENNDPVEPE